MFFDASPQLSARRIGGLRSRPERPLRGPLAPRLRSAAKNSYLLGDYKVFPLLFYNHRVKVISIVDTFLVLLSPSLGGISSVPIVIFPTFSSFMNLRLVISATSTAVVIACPLAFKVTFLALDPVKLVITAKT